jgi:hypothetical protein
MIAAMVAMPRSTVARARARRNTSLDVVNAIRTVRALRAFRDTPAQAPGRGKKQRKTVGEVVSRERFGQPFA